MTTTINKKEKRDLVTLLYDKRVASVYFTDGKFDGYLVGLNMPGNKKPIYLKDEQYFTYFQGLTKEEQERTYQDFVKIYNITTNRIQLGTVKKISDLSKEYEDSDGWKIRMTVIYYGMIAEENKKDENDNELPLRKRVKRLGMYQTLVEGMSPKDAANFSKKKNADYLDKLMEERGF